jgi:hypothetical protein
MISLTKQDHDFFFSVGEIKKEITSDKEGK